MRTVFIPGGLRSPKFPGLEAREALRNICDRAAPHVAVIVAETVCISRKIAEHIPEDAKRGFRDGRKAGNKLINHDPYAIGASAGFVFGVGEAVVGAVAVPTRLLLGLGLELGVWAIRTVVTRSRSGD